MIGKSNRLRVVNPNMCLITFKRNAVFRGNRLKAREKGNGIENETNRQGTEIKKTVRKSSFIYDFKR